MTPRTSEGNHGFALTRRQLVGVGTATVAAAALGFRAAGADIQALVQTGATPAPPADGFIEPPVRASQDGNLVTTLQAMEEEIAGQPRLGYSDMLPGPTLRFHPGDTVKVALVNALSEQTDQPARAWTARLAAGQQRQCLHPCHAGSDVRVRIRHSRQSSNRNVLVPSASTRPVVRSGWIGHGRCHHHRRRAG